MRVEEDSFSEELFRTYTEQIENSETKAERESIAKNIELSKEAGHITAKQASRLATFINKIEGEPVMSNKSAQNQEDWEDALLDLFKAARAANEKAEELKKESKEARKQAQDLEEQLKLLILEGSAGYGSRLFT